MRTAFLFLLFWGCFDAFAQVQIIAEESVINAEKARHTRRSSEDHIVAGYRIFIGMRSNRADANLLKMEVDEKLDSTFTAQIIYDEPNFKVYVGAYPNNAEADEAMAEIRKVYSNAKKIRMPIPFKREE